MFLLDTNVVSELRKSETKEGDRSVEAWGQSIPLEQTYTYICAVTIFELERGVLSMERRDNIQGIILRQWLEGYVLVKYAERIFPFSTAVARRCALLHIPDPMPVQDAMIAATALVHGLTVVTRNVKDFERTGVRLLNPWEYS